MEKSADAFRTISEVAEELDLPQHVLRFWETRFAQIKPLKRGGGRRYYRPDDVELLRAIRYFLYGQGYTIKGVQRILKEQGPRAIIGALPPSESVFATGSLADEQSLAETWDDLSAAYAPEETAQTALADRMESTGVTGERQNSADDFYVENVPFAAVASGVQRSLSQEDLSLLTGILVELAECERILQQARDV
jgi:DNA-binding transcriptional MerR regulator